MTATQADKAKQFRSLHKAPETFVGRAEVSRGFMRVAETEQR